MPLKRLVLLPLLLLIQSAQAEPAIPYTLSVEPEVDRSLVPLLSQVIGPALTFVKTFPPTGQTNHLFAWKADREILKGKTLRIALASSRSKAFLPIFANTNVSEMDSLTMAPINKDKKTMDIMVVLLVDRIFFDRAGHELKDSFSRLIVALAHSIYGNVQYLLEADINKFQTITMADQQRHQRQSFEASVMFLGALKSHVKFASLPPSIREGLMGLLPREVRALRSWQQGNPGSEPEPACAAMLEAIQKGFPTLH